MATFNEFDCFARDLCMEQHKLTTDAFKFRLSNAAPTATMNVITCITTIATGNGWATDGALTISSAATSGATFVLNFSDVTVEAAAASAMASFRYVVIYNDTPATPGDTVTDPLIGWYDYGTVVTLASGEKFVIDFDTTNKFLRIA